MPQGRRRRDMYIIKLSEPRNSQGKCLKFVPVKTEKVTIVLWIVQELNSHFFTYMFHAALKNFPPSHKIHIPAEKKKKQRKHIYPNDC